MLVYPDTIIFDPVQSGLQAPGQTYQGGRLMNALGHTDGIILGRVGSMITDSPNLAPNRLAAGNWVLARTAAGAETYHVTMALNDSAILRTGEQYQLGEFSANPANQTDGGPAGPKGVQVNDIFVTMLVGIVALTSATLGLTSTLFAAPGAASAVPVITPVIAPGALAVGTTISNGFATQRIAVATPGYTVTDITALDIELTVTMANTGILYIAGMGAHVSFNFD